MVRIGFAEVASSTHHLIAHDQNPSTTIHQVPLTNLTCVELLLTLILRIRMSSVDNVHLQETAEEPAEVAVDGSAGSDTDTGGPLKQTTASKDHPEVPHHARSNSVKKPISFKPLSVTKNFLAKAGTPTAAAAKTNGDSGMKLLFCIQFRHRS